MLVGFRKNILIGGLLFSLLLIIILISAIYFLFASGFNFNDFSLLKSNTWWFTYEFLSSQYIHIWAFLSIFLILVFILISGIMLRILFKKTASPELFFYTIFLFSFSFESFRILNIFFYFYQTPLYFCIFNSRLVYFGRIFGILSIFCSSLYAVEIKYQKFNILISVSILLALILAYSLPMDSTILLTNFLYRLGDEVGIFFLNYAFVFFIILNFLIAAIKRQKRFFYIVLAVFIVLSGRELLFFIANPAMIIINLFLIAGGTILFSRQIDKIYLWF